MLARFRMPSCPLRKRAASRRRRPHSTDKLIATIREIERKGADNPYTAINGNMFTLLSAQAGGLAMRLPEDEREKFLKEIQNRAV